ncbi:cation:proton antiporter [Paracoccus tegillarcae]|nr:cation:proton antiporter [Paracoccus tegillarcae]
MSYEIFLAMLGFGVLSSAIVPALARRMGWRLPVSVPIACLFGGIGVGLVFDGIPVIDPIGQGVLVQRITEMAVILSLTGGGLKLDRAIGLRSWASTWRLLALTMPICILALAGLGWAALGLPVAAALLLGAVMAPTDPVLAASVQVGPPGEAKETEARFALTSEAGLNDGLAFPFVYLAIAATADRMAETGGPGDEGSFDPPVLWEWLAIDVFWKIAAGLVMGWLIGRFLGWAVFRLAPRKGVSDAFLALGLTLFAYGVTEMVNGYGFIAVFIAALTFRRFERDHSFHTDLHHYVEQTEMIFLICVVFVTGIAIAQGILAPLGLSGLLVAGLFLFVVRPLAGWMSLSGLKLTRGDRFAISVLGIRGVGSMYYLAYGLNHAPYSMESGRLLWAIVALIVAISVVAHGIGAPRLMSRLTPQDD